eukprot:s5505_g6.t1
MGLGEVGTQGNEGGKGLRARRTLEGLGEDTGDFLQADTGGQRGGGVQGSIVWGLQWESKERGEKAVPLLTLWGVKSFYRERCLGTAGLEGFGKLRDRVLEIVSHE